MQHDFCPYVTAVPWISSTMLYVKMVKKNILAVFLVLVKKLSMLKDDISCSFFVNVRYEVEKAFFSPLFGGFL